MNAGALGIELEEEGPVRNGDRCLFGAANLLYLIATLYPPGTDWYDTTARRVEEHAEVLLRYYPESEWAEEAQQLLDDVA